MCSRRRCSDSPGFYVQKRTVREYTYPYAAHVWVMWVRFRKSDIEEDDYYQAGDYIGNWVSKFYEKQLRGEKGVKIMLRDATEEYRVAIRMVTRPETCGWKGLDAGIGCQVAGLGRTSAAG